MTDAVFVSDGTVPEFVCPACARISDAVMGIGYGAPAGRPTPGSSMICAYCGTVLIITEVGPRLATNEEVNALPDFVKEIAASYGQKATPKKRPTS